MTDEAIFPRNFLKAYPVALRGEGCFVHAVGGRRYLDASGGAAVVTIGHGVAQIAQAIAEQSTPLSPRNWLHAFWLWRRRACAGTGASSSLPADPKLPRRR